MLGVIIETILIVTVTILEIVSFWDEIISTLQSIIEKIEKMVSGILYGTKLFVQKVKGIIHRISKHYSYDETEDQWYETVRDGVISRNDIPGEILDRVRYSEDEEDITDEFQEELKNCYS